MFNTYFLFNLHLYNNFMLFDILPAINLMFQNLCSKLVHIVIFKLYLNEVS